MQRFEHFSLTFKYSSSFVTAWPTRMSPQDIQSALLEVGKNQLHLRQSCCCHSIYEALIHQNGSQKNAKSLSPIKVHARQTYAINFGFARAGNSCGQKCGGVRHRTGLVTQQTSLILCKSGRPEDVKEYGLSKSDRPTRLTL